MAISFAVEVFKKYDSNLTIGQLFKFKEYRDLHISKLSLFDKLNKALHKYGPYMNHKTFLQYIHNKDKRTWYYDQMEDLQTFWQRGLEFYLLDQQKGLHDLIHFAYRVEAFLGGLETLSQGKLFQSLIHPRRLQKLL